jgi:hypothetical protein
MHKTQTIDSTSLPTPADVCRYEERGWFITPNIVPHELLDSARSAIQAHHKGQRDRQLPGSARFTDWQPGDGNGVRNSEFCSLQNDGVRELAMLPVIGAIAARLARCQSIRLFDDQAIHKPSETGCNATAVGWHTDHSYWSTCTSYRMLTAWIPLQDATVENGTLYVVDGSHRWPESEHVRGFNDPDLETLGRRLGRTVPASQVLPIQMSRGQVSFHHKRTLHASAPNIASHDRYALAVHMQDDNNRYRAFSTSAGLAIVLPHDQLCRHDRNGIPDYTDPEIFPQIWPVVSPTGNAV